MVYLLGLVLLLVLVMQLMIQRLRLYVMLIGFVQKLGLPIMTGVILGSSIMAIFGKLAWPAIVMLVVFTAIFFGAGKLMAKFAAGLNSDGVNAQSFKCVDGGGATLGGAGNVGR
ncbi:type IV secretion system protein VirB2 [Anaplasma centrale str. Israel]|uniref:Type IV secretion system protein VirB2 n=1 Tax=Anaplasma centrale (strain Israel) TaxID=574556 RepID=D1AT29_ANACI|nr:type IV secretion system protein VirB2 [Anaplasma centrale str. Israel]